MEGADLAERGDSTRARILDEGLRLASRDGLEGLSIGALAGALGLSKSGLFAHFGSKEALQVAVLEHAAGRVQARVAPAAGIAPGPERLRFLFRASLDWIDDPERPGGCPITGACIEFDDREGPVREALERLQRGTQERIAEQFDAFRHPGRDREQLAFEYRGLTLAYHHAARMLRAGKARAWALAGLEELIARAGGPPPAENP
jgi:AcrR family transcriptional regulator